MDIIKVDNITKTFGIKGAKVQALNGVSLAIKEGEMLAIMGKSGSGKSTLLNILGCLMKMDSGEYWYRGQKQDLTSPHRMAEFRRDELGFIVQYFALIEDINIYKNVALPLKYQKKKRTEIKERVNDVLGKLGIADKAKAYPDELSGGQQQRAAIARAIVKEPEIILADEPTGALDEQTGNTIMDILSAMNKQGKTIVIVTHDSKVAGCCSRVIELRDGRVV